MAAARPELAAAVAALRLTGSADVSGRAAARRRAGASPRPRSGRGRRRRSAGRPRLGDDQRVVHQEGVGRRAATMWSAMPSTRVLATETVPSSGPGQQRREQRVHRAVAGDDAEVEVDRRRGGRRCRRRRCRARCRPGRSAAGRSRGRRSASTTSEPAFGGASMTTRPRFAGRFSREPAAREDAAHRVGDEVDRGRCRRLGRRRR